MVKFRGPIKMSKNAEKKKFLTLRSRWSNDRRKTSVLFFFME